MSRPQPIPESLICSECGLDWALHPENPRRRDCIDLLVIKNKNIQTIPWYSTHHCNWGHINCWEHHQYSITYSGSTGNVISSTYFISDDDDPDMGIPAIVS